MKRLSTFLCALVSLCATAVMAQAPFDSGPAPKQSFQQGGQPPVQQPPSTPPTAAPAPAMPEGVTPNTADPNVVKRTVTPNAAPNATPGATAPTNPLVPGNDAAALQILQQEFTQAQNKANDQIAALTQANQQMQAQMQKFAEAVVALSQQIEQLRGNMKTTQASNPWLQKLQAADNSLTTEMKLILIAVLFIVAMLLGALLSGRKKSAANKSASLATNTMATKKAVASESKAAPAKAATKMTPAEDDTENEYDFMGTTEAIPAKLDLARAYVAMEDYNAAKNALQEVIAEGNAQQKKEAQEISASMPS